VPTRRDDADERLRAYRAKRDFSITAEPAGTDPPAADGWRFVVQRHRASHLHYDVRLEAGGVLVSWAVPKGPTLDPKARRLAVHVEDHPLDYYDFEGVIAAGEYGGGDVIVWDWGTWALAEGHDPLQEIAKGDLHLALSGDKLRGRFALVRRGSDRRAREQWLLIKKRDEDAVPGWDPEEHPRSVKSGRTNDEVLAAPAASWSGRGSWAGPTDDELDALDALGKSGHWALGGHELRLTNLDKVLFPGRGRGGKPLTKRDLIRHHAVMAPVMLPYLADRAVNMHRFPDGVGTKSFWHKEVPSHAPEWLRRWRNEDADPGETQDYIVPDSAASVAWLANFGALELHPWTSRVDAPQRPTWALFDIDPGGPDDFATVLQLARLHRTALAHLGVEGRPKVTGKRGIQIWVPVASRYSFTDTRRWVETISRAIGATLPDVVSWEWEVRRRNGLVRLDYTQNAINKTLVAPFSARPAPGAPVSVPLTWDELDDDDLRPDRWTIRDIGARLRQVGDPLAPLVGMQQQLPPL
jgi:bifunctional non-homologous end joining protein LigD